jgi:hypothetical protein
MHSDRQKQTPWNRGLLEKLTVTQLVKKFAAFYGTQKFITSTGLYPEPDESNPHLPTLLPYDPL